jgi:2-phospho-L-lactate/phosphoenolpyruvate guanylyltransferase
LVDYMICAIVPVKSLSLAKGRLAGILTAAERQALVLAMLGDVLAALGAARGVDQVGVVSQDREVLALAADARVQGLHDRAQDLNGALALAAAHYASSGATAVLVVPADVPLITQGEIERFVGMHAGARGVALAPSRDGGTNALLVWPPLALPFQFGRGSLARHQEMARERGLAPRLFHAPGLELDVDRPNDLLQISEMDGETATQRLTRKLGVRVRDVCLGM